MLDSLRIVTSDSLAATRPDTVVIEAGPQTRRAAIGPDGTVRFAPLRANRLVLHLSRSTGLRVNAFATVGDSPVVGIGVSEVSIPGVATTAREASDALPVVVACGSGPALTLDGRVIRTSVRTTVRALRDGEPVTATLCGGGSLLLGAGGHRLLLASGGAWTAQGVLLRRIGAPVAGTQPPTAVHVRSWGSTARTVGVGPRPAPVVLVVNENANRGWQARLDGQRLRSVTIDGWRQGYLLPAGAAGLVHLDYAPQRPYAAGLIVGAGAVVILLLLIVLPVRRRAASGAGALERRHAAAAVVTVALALSGGVVGALVGVGALVLAVLLRRTRGARAARVVLPSSAAALVVIAGVALSIGHAGTPDYLANRWWMQALCLGAVALTGASGLLTRPAGSGRRRAAPAPGVADAGPDAPPTGTPPRPAEASAPG